MSEFLSYRDGGKTSEEGFSRWWAKTHSGGMPTVLDSTSLKASQRGSGANMSVDIAIGDVLVPYTTYMFHGFTDAIKNVSISAAHPTSPRRSIVVAYVDLSVVSSASNNNPGALKFLSVDGAPSGTPIDPNDAAIQAAVGIGNPWMKIARIAVDAAATSIVDAKITDMRQPISFKGRLWGGTSNQNGHIIPNVTDSTLIVSTTGLVETANLATSSVTDSKLSVTKSAFFAFRNTSVQTIANNTLTVVVFNSEDYDKSSEYDNTTGRFTATVPGVYQVGAQIRLSAAGGGTTAVGVYKNGTLMAEANRPNAVAFESIPVSCQLDLVATDFVEIKMLQNSGASRDVEFNRNNFFYMSRSQL
jgi:hypothetical protein